MARQVDLNELRETLLKNQQSGAGERPQEQSSRVFVDPNGKIVMGEDVRGKQERTLSEVPQSVFAGGA